MIESLLEHDMPFFFFFHLVGVGYPLFDKYFPWIEFETTNYSTLA